MSNNKQRALVPETTDKQDGFYAVGRQPQVMNVLSISEPEPKWYWTLFGYVAAVVVIVTVVGILINLQAILTAFQTPSTNPLDIAKLIWFWL